MTADEQYREILATLQRLFPPGRVIEIRILGEDGVASGYFSDFQKAAAEIVVRDNDPRGSGIYVTLNEVSEALIARRSNRIKYRIGRQDQTTADADIVRRWWLPVDIDPVRTSGISSSESEHADALVRADTIGTFLNERGWPDPVIADSGNGAHLLYPIDLPNDDVSRNLVRSVLEALDHRFSDSRCKVDTANFNAARIWKVYGTTSRKGDNIADRPHRRSRILCDSPPGEVVLPSYLNALVEELQPVKEEKNTRKMGIESWKRTGTCSEVSEFDLCSWLSEHGLSTTTKPYQGGRLFSFDQCPFSDAHRDGAFAIQFENGAIFAGCHHDSCGSGRQRWSELRAKFDSLAPSKPDFETRFAQLRSSRIRAKLIAEGRIDPDEEQDNLADRGERPEKPCSPDVSLCVSLESVKTESDYDECREQALEILNSGDPLLFLLETFGVYHEGDRSVAECLVHSLASRFVLNSKGLHVSITGESGKGKSHAIETMCSLVPEQFRLEGRLSDKALFYMEDLMPGTVITLDDVSLSDQMQEILKGVTTSFQKPFPYRTVNKDRKPQICTIPERCVWWIARVEGSGDDQVFNRMLTCWIDDSQEQDQKVVDRTLAGAEQLPGTQVQECGEVRICRQIWEEMDRVWVVIPFGRRIRFQSLDNRRNPDMLLDLIRTNAALRQQQRQIQVVNDTVCVVATEDDFLQARRLFVALNGEDGGQVNKLTKREAALITIIDSLNHSEVTIRELQSATGWTNSSVSKLIHGYQCYGKTYSGLLEKCPAISYLDRTVSRGDDGCTTLRRSKVYLWDSDLYHAWIKGGLVWLINEPEGGCSDPPVPGDPDQNNRVKRIEKDVKRSEVENGEKNKEKSEDDSAQKGEDDGVHPVTCEPAQSPQQFISADLTGERSLVEDVRSDEREPLSASLTSIIPDNFILIDGFADRRRCSVCGKRPTQYRERMASSGLREPSRPEMMLCKSCYMAAVSRVAASMILLDGVIETELMTRQQHVSRRCDLCSLMPAVWTDSGTHTHLCDPCYQRERERHNSSRDDSGKESGHSL